MSTPLHVARHLLAQGQAWLLFIEIPLFSGGSFRLVRNTRHVQANGYIWQAASMVIDLPAEEADGSLGSLAISVPNVSRLPISYVEVSDELLGAEMTCQLAHEGNMATFEPGLSWRHLITTAVATEQALRIESQHPAAITRVPSRIFDRTVFRQLLPRR